MAVVSLSSSFSSPLFSSCARLLFSTPDQQPLESLQYGSIFSHQRQ
uniref:Uncharacterized protein n=1 Tax=Solanum lycopersicum TaxID=4081 RepID=A0A3Q7GTL2_SOLLC